MVKILKAAGISFGILGKGELCCGDPARRLGEESLFLDLARRNMQRFRENHVKQIVTLCPHCLNTLKNEYPLIEDGSGSKEDRGMEVFHAAEYVMGLIEEKRLSPKYPISGKVALHDPCYLGRINGIYRAPREVIRSLPEARFRELGRHHEKGFCCGGGGGGMWLHEQLGRRMNVLRAEEVSQAGVELLGTACPYCLTMLEDGINSLELENPPKVMDIIEMVADSIG
jgi:Fe-S oxidoreductase